MPPQKKAIYHWERMRFWSFAAKRFMLILEFLDKQQRPA